MKLTVSVAAVLWISQGAHGFVAPSRFATKQPTAFFATPDTKEETKTEASAEGGDDEEVEGLPWWWDMVWKLDMMQTTPAGTEVAFADNANVLRTNIEQIYGGFPSVDGCPLAEGAITDIADGTMFIGLQRYNNNYGSPYKLCFGPKSFLVVSDPVQIRHLLRDANDSYDKVCTRQLPR